MNLDEIKRRLKIVASCNNNPEAIYAAIRELDEQQQALADAASALVLVSAQRDTYRDTLVKIRKLVTSDDVPIAVLTEIVNLVSRLNFSDAAQPQKEPS